MTIDPSKLTVEQSKLFDELKVGGLNAAELEQLRRAGVNDELLAAMKAEFPDTGEIPNSEPEMPEEKGLFAKLKDRWQNADGWGKAKIVGEALLTGLVGVLGIFQSCTPSDHLNIQKGSTINVITTIGITINSSSQEIINQIKQWQEQDNKTSTEILDELKKCKVDSDKMLEVLQDLLNEAKDGNKKADDIKAILEVVVAQLDDQGIDIKAILEKLEGMGVDLKDIVTVLKENGKTLKDIHDALLQQGENQKDIVALLMAIGTDVDEIKDMLKELGKNDNDIKELLKGVYDNTTNLLGTNKEILEKLNEIAGKIANGQGGAVDFNDLKPIIEEAVNKLIATYNGGNEKVLAKLQEILEKIPAGCKCDSSQILAKLEIIIKELQNPEGNHEGVLDDLDDIFG